MYPFGFNAGFADGNKKDNSDIRGQLPELSQASKIKLFTVNYFRKSCIIDVWLGSGYNFGYSGQTFSGCI